MDYQIRLKGQLDPAWFGDFVVTYTTNGDTLLTGTNIDQAALHGIFARCRDLGITFISVNPISKETLKMNIIRAEASTVIDARPEEIYAVIADYVVGHAAILPKPYFTGMTVEKGGQGAGTLVMTRLKVFGQEMAYHQLVSEPQPGRVLVETDIDTGQFSRFTLEPLNGGTQTRVTIDAENPASPGFKGFVERLTSPAFMRRIFLQELQNLAAYVSQQRVVNVN